MSILTFHEKPKSDRQPAAKRRAMRRVDHWHAQATAALQRMQAGPVERAVLEDLAALLRAAARNL